MEGSQDEDKLVYGESQAKFILMLALIKIIVVPTILLIPFKIMVDRFTPSYSMSYPDTYLILILASIIMVVITTFMERISKL